MTETNDSDVLLKQKIDNVHNNLGRGNEQDYWSKVWNNVNLFLTFANTHRQWPIWMTFTYEHRHIINLNDFH